MANFYGMTRSNYFKVKDYSKFEEICRDFELEVIYEKGKVGFLLDNETGIILSGDIVNENIEMEKYPPDLCADQLIAEILEDDEVMIIQSIGNEKYRYFIGFVQAFNNKGESYTISLNDIYENVSHIGKNVTRCEF